MKTPFLIFVALSIAFCIFHYELWRPLNEVSPLLSSIATFLAVIVALYLGSWREKLEKPYLKITFPKNKSYPFFHTLSFGKYNLQIVFVNLEIEFNRPGFILRVKVENRGMTTAKKVQAKIEKIVFPNNDGSVVERFYYPTPLKWSGERRWIPLDIPKKSHQFLDFFWAFNESTPAISKFNYDKFSYYNIKIQKDIIEKIIRENIEPSEEVVWNLWVDNSYDMGIPEKIDFEGDFKIHFFITGENISPVKLVAKMNWSKEKWNSPDIKFIERD